MTILEIEAGTPLAEGVKVTATALNVTLRDGRSLAVPLCWFPRLQQGTASERNRWRLIGRGAGIHWEDLDEDISVEGLLAGRASGESQSSLKRWMQTRSDAKKSDGQPFKGVNKKK